MRRNKQIIIAILLATAPCASACGPSVTQVPMPEGLMGRWTTTDPAYADRYFEFSANSIVLGTGARTRARYIVTRVLQDQDDRGVLYTVEYTDSLGGDFAMTFYFDANRGWVHLKNQLQITWRR